MSKTKVEFSPEFLANMKNLFKEHELFNQTKAKGIKFFEQIVTATMLTDSAMREAVISIAGTAIYAECARKQRSPSQPPTLASGVRTVVNRTRRQTLDEQETALVAQQRALTYYKEEGLLPGQTPKEANITPKEILNVVAKALPHIPGIVESVEPPAETTSETSAETTTTVAEREAA